MARRSALRLALLGGVLGYAALALGNGLDRAAARNPALAGYVPGPLKAEAWRAESARALEAGNNSRAIETARLAVLADPVDPRSAALLGAGHLAAREQVRADGAFRIAARFGWRDPLTQLYFMNAALGAGQPRLAALRLDAILRQAPNFPVRDMLLAQFEGTAQGRAALAERLALRPAWTFVFLNHTSQVPVGELRARAEIVGAMQPVWGCDAVAPLVTALVLKQAVPDARRLWQAQCPAAAPGLADSHFAAIPKSRTPVAFEWNLFGSGNVATRVSGSGSGLLAQASGPSAEPIAWQALVLSPGRYRIGWSATTDGATAAPGTGVSLGCNFSETRQLEATPVAGRPGRFEALAEIDGSCAARYLVLWLRPGTAEVRFDDLAVTPL